MLPNQDLLLVDTTDACVRTQTYPFFFTRTNLFCSLQTDSYLSFSNREKYHRKFEGILEPKKIKSVTASTSPSLICHEVMGLDAMILDFLMLNFNNIEPEYKDPRL